MPTNVRVNLANVNTDLQAEIDAQRNIIYRQTTAPGAAVDGDIWQDTSVTPNVLKIKVSGAWQSSGTVNTGILAQLVGQITSSNYSTYLGAGAVTARAFAQNKTTHASTLTTSINFDSGGQSVIALISGRGSSKALATTVGWTRTNLDFTVAGTLVYTDQVARMQNLLVGDSENYNFIAAQQAIYIASPGSGSVSYSLTAYLTHNSGSTGSGQLISWPTIILFTLKV
jgi:hypothetical protein